MARSPRALGLVLAVATALVGACTQGTSSSSVPGTSPIGSGQPSACRSAPQLDDLPADWRPPAAAPSIIPILVANPGELTCGRNRLIFLFVDAANNVISAPNRAARIAVYNLARDPAKVIATADGTFVWAIENVRGVYIATVDLPEAGTYGAEFTTTVDGKAQAIRVTFDVSATSPVVQVGGRAPATKTPTAADGGGNLATISTDPTPDAALYQTSVDQALAAHKPFALIFATPKFCTSAQCGPTLERIKPFVARYPGVAFIHVEPYQLKLEGGALQAVLDGQNNLVPNEVSNAWGLTSEPWVFVVDRNGVVAASLELIFSDDELAAALDAVK